MNHRIQEGINAAIIDKHYSDGSTDRYFLGWLISGNKLYYNVIVQNHPSSKIIFSGHTKPEKFSRLIEQISNHPFYTIDNIKDKIYRFNRQDKLSMSTIYRQILYQL